MALQAKLTEVTEGWSKWDLALYVGAPIALGLAGVWLYRRGKQSSDGEKVDSNQNDEKLGDDAAGKTVQSSEPQSLLEQAQNAKNKGNKLFKAQRYDQALDCYTLAIELCPPEHTAERATFHQNRAATYHNLGKPDKVLEDCTEALRLNPRYVKAMSRRAKVLEGQGRLREALADVTAVCILEEFANQDSLILADRVLKDLGWQRARQAYAERKPLAPSKFYVKNYLSGFAADPILHVSKVTTPEGQTPQPGGQGDADTTPTPQAPEPEATPDTPQGGEGAAAPAVNGNTEGGEEDSPYQRAVQEVEAGRYDQVLELCSVELEREGSPHKHMARLLRGTFYILHGLGDKAMADLQLLTDDESVNPRVRSNAYIKLASLLMQKGDNVKSREYYDQAALIDPSNPDIFYHRGQQQLLGEHYDLAISDFTRSSDLAPLFPSPAVQRLYTEHRRAMAYKDVISVQRVEKQWKELLKQFPTYSDAHLLCAQAKCDLGMFPDAEKLFDTAIRLEPDNPNTLVHRGLMKLQSGKPFEEAVELIQAALKLDPQCEYAYEVLGTLEVQRGNMTQAEELFKKAIGLSRSESEMAHLFSLLDAAEVQLEVARKLGVALPPGMGGV